MYTISLLTCFLFQRNFAQIIGKASSACSKKNITIPEPLQFCNSRKQFYNSSFSYMTENEHLNRTVSTSLFSKLYFGSRPSKNVIFWVMDLKKYLFNLGHLPLQRLFHVTYCKTWLILLRQMLFFTTSLTIILKLKQLSISNENKSIIC